MQDKNSIQHTIKAFLDEFTTTLQPDVFVVDVIVKISLKKAKVIVLIDADGESQGISIDRCAEISRWLDEKIETAGLFTDSYELEVSSPGVGEPLKHPRQWQNMLNRRLEVHLKDGTIKTGLLTALKDSSITISEEIAPKNPKNKQKQIVENVDIQRDMIAQVKGLVQLK